MRRTWIAALLRPYGKKRGPHSRTSVASGILAELAFYAGLILTGAFVLALVIMARLMAERVGIELPDEARRVLESELARGGDSRWGQWIVGFVSVAAIGSGMAGLFYRLNHLGFSQERLSANKQRILESGTGVVKGNKAGGSANTTALPETSDSNAVLQQMRREPTVPSGRAGDESPGEWLAHRLPMLQAGRTRILGTAALSLIWNSVCIVLFAVVVSGWWYNRNRPILAMMMLPFTGISIWSLRSLTAEVRRVAGVGPTLVEINAHPIHPAETYQVVVAQLGRMRLKQMKVSLVCEEQSFFRQGTDVRVEKHLAFEQEVLVSTNVRVDPGQPWKQQFEVPIPANAMHSFVAENNAIRWRLVISGEARPWPSFCRSFPIFVRPREPRRGHVPP
ncbi:MAG: hypothetical protein AAGD07_02845 [Planctomycetota bacterium]